MHKYVYIYIYVNNSMVGRANWVAYNGLFISFYASWKFDALNVYIHLDTKILKIIGLRNRTLVPSIKKTILAIHLKFHYGNSTKWVA